LAAAGAGRVEKNAPLGAIKKGLESVPAAAGCYRFFQTDHIMADGAGWGFSRFCNGKKGMGLLPASLYVQIGKRPQLVWLIAIGIFLNQQENRLHQAVGIGEDFRLQEPGEGR
jgi:hypothetical protein